MYPGVHITSLFLLLVKLLTKLTCQSDEVSDSIHVFRQSVCTLTCLLRYLRLYSCTALHFSDCTWFLKSESNPQVWYDTIYCWDFFFRRMTTVLAPLLLWHFQFFYHVINLQIQTEFSWTQPPSIPYLPKPTKKVVAISAVITHFLGDLSQIWIFYIDFESHCSFLLNPFVTRLVVFEKSAIVPFLQWDLCHIHYSPRKYVRVSVYHV
jgi:hypothetical protein